MLPGLLLAAPALVLLLPLVLGCYPGERLLLDLAARRRAPAGRAPRPRALVAAPRRPALRILPRGGLLLADAIAGRGPPRAPAGTVASR